MSFLTTNKGKTSKYLEPKKPVNDITKKDRIFPWLPYLLLEGSYICPFLSLSIQDVRDIGDKKIQINLCWIEHGIQCLEHAFDSNICTQTQDCLHESYASSHKVF